MKYIINIKFILLLSILIGCIINLTLIKMLLYKQNMIKQQQEEDKMFGFTEYPNI